MSGATNREGPPNGRSITTTRARGHGRALLLSMLLVLPMASPYAAWAEGMTLRLAPAYEIPLGADPGVFGPLNLGGTFSFGLKPGLLGLSWLSPEFGAGYVFSSLAGGAASLNSIEGQVGLAAAFPLAKNLSLRASLDGRVVWYILSTGGEPPNGVSPGLAGELGLDLSLSPSLAMGIGAAGGYDFGMIGFVRPYLAAAYRLGAKADGAAPESAYPEAAKPEPLARPAGPSAASKGLVLRVSPAYEIPLGADPGVMDPWNFEGSVTAGFLRGLLGPSWLQFEIGLAYAYANLNADPSAMSAIEGLYGLGADIPLSPKLDLRAALYGRVATYILTLGSDKVVDTSPGVGGEIGVDFRLGPAFTLGLGAAGGYDFGMIGYLRPYLSTVFSLGGGQAGESSPAVKQPASEKPKPLVGKKPAKEPPAAAPAPQPAAAVAAAKETGPLEANLDGIFPVYYKYYDENSFGTLTVRNTGKASWSDIKVSVAVKQIMDSPRVASIQALAPGEAANVEATALFNDDILGVTEATKLSCDLTLEYKEGGKAQRLVKSLSLRIYDRNAMTWSDDRSAAAFITAKDPAILGFAKSLAGDSNAAKNPVINGKLQLAAAVHDALCLYGVNYVTDPTSVFSGTKSKTDVDFLQFPRQTLEYRAGDCDDLSILYCAFLEAIGIESAFITVPGHIFVAASLDMSPEEARSRFTKVDDFIMRDGKTWVPIEITMRKGGFLPAWAEGAKEWRESVARAQATLIPVHDAWQLYEPVALPGSSSLAPLQTAKAVDAMKADMEAFVLREIGDRAAKLQADIKKAQGTSRPTNSLGLLYAQYGLFDKAKNIFESVLAKEEYAPSLVNLGNVLKLQGQTEGALSLYERAYKKAPANAYVLLALAMTNQELENYGVVRKYYQELKKTDAALADRYSFLDIKGEEGTKAAEAAGLKNAIEWVEVQ